MSCVPILPEQRNRGKSTALVNGPVLFPKKVFRTFSQQNIYFPREPTRRFPCVPHICARQRNWKPSQSFISGSTFAVLVRFLLFWSAWSILGPLFYFSVYFFTWWYVIFGSSWDVSNSIVFLIFEETFVTALDGVGILIGLNMPRVRSPAVRPVSFPVQTHSSFLRVAGKRQ